MATIKDVLSHKGGQVMSIGPDASVLDAALLMNEHRIGALVVLEGGKIQGIFTERDVLRRVVAERRNPGATRIHEVMTRHIVTCDTGTRLDEARKIFLDRRIRHLPVIGDRDELLGMVSIGDLNAWELCGQEVEIKHLHQYIYGVVA